MAQVQFTLTLTVAVASAPLAEGASSGAASFTVGVPSSQILTPITGGVPPYNAVVDFNSPNPLPPGLAASIDANNNLVISGTATVAGGPAPVLIDVTDSTGASVASVRTHFKT